MSRVRVLVGTRKGAFVLEADGKREQWDVSGPHFAGWEIYHVKGSPVDPNRLYASQSSGWFGQLIQRSNDGGKTLGAGGQQVRLRRRARHAPVVRRHAAPVGVQARLASRTVADRSRHGRTPAWKTPPCSARPMAARRGRSWPACAATAPGRVAAGRRRDVPAHDPAGSRATRNGCSSPSRRPARSAPTTAARPGGRSTAACGRNRSPTRRPRSATACIASRCIASRPDVLFMQKHWDVMRSDDGGENWREVSGNLPTDFGFPIDVHAHEPETIYVVPIKSDSEHYPPEGKLRVYRSRTGGNEWEALTNGAAAARLLRQRLRDAMAVDSLDRAACISAPPAGRCTRRPMPATAGRRSCAICRPCCRWRCRHCA